MRVSQPNLRRARLLALGLVATSPLVAAGPCDIYAAGNTPCVAAHSTTRALYSAFSGPLYQVKRADGKTLDITTLSAGGVANASAQDSFCTGTTCVISTIYDQSRRANHLTQAPPGGAARGSEAGGYDKAAGATGAPVALNATKAYGVFISPGTGYRNNKCSGTATGNQPEGMYAVFDGTHFNSACCFDYGNAETNSRDTGAGHMEAIYFGNCKYWGSGAGNGPWIMADLEDGLFSGVNPKNNPADPTISHRFLTAIIKGQPNHWAIRGGNAASGLLSTFYNGTRPRGYTTMHNEGAIILGTGGDNSNGAQGTFYEGAMTAGYPSDETENAVQADIIAAGYATTSAGHRTTRRPLVGSTISLRSTAAGGAASSLAHDGSVVGTQVVSLSSSTAIKKQASWLVHTGLARSDCISFESTHAPGSFIRHENFKLAVHANDNSKQFQEDATFCLEDGLNGLGYTIRSWNYPTRYLRQYNNIAYIASNGGGVYTFDDAASFNDDASWDISDAFV